MKFPLIIFLYNNFVYAKYTESINNIFVVAVFNEVIVFLIHNKNTHAPPIRNITNIKIPIRF